MTDHNSLPKWLMPVVTVALIWNLMGVSVFIMQIMLTPDAIAELPPAEAALYENIPLWVNVAFAIAVCGGALGCILLLVRKSLAYPILGLSLLGVLVQMYHAFVMTNSFEVYGPAGTIMPIMVVLIASGLLWLAKAAKQNNWTE
ncbi:hypothetical protein QX776_02915 [Alteromonadaceae bacterium BrNp21-10]|nr:hypothetical protein [Alteromonadaceae bacterium BrNp21-10]